MIRLKDLVSKMHILFRVMIETDAYIDVAYKGKLYRLRVEDTGLEAPRRKRKVKRGQKQKALVQKITSSKCLLCGSLSLNGVCTMPAKHQSDINTDTKT